jgi:serine/threonine-protein kinase
VEAGSSVRFCPLCEAEVDGPICPKHAVPTVAVPRRPAIDVGSVIDGRYRVERLLGEGGMGSVYLATHVNIDRKVAIKVIAADRAADPAALKRFYREAQAVSQLDHPNIVQVFAFGVDEATHSPWIAMEFVDGGTLKEILRAGPISEERAVRLLIQATKALVEAHAKGIVHRDLKPDNMIVRRLPDGDEHLKVVDFGVAKIRQTDSNPKGPSLTAGHAVGTPLYMSPEQVKGDPVDARSDLYSLGCILHQMLAGAPPFVADDAIAIMVKQSEDPPPPLPAALADGRAPSDAIQTLRARLLEKDPGARPPSAIEVARALDEIVRMYGSGDISGGRSFEQVTLAPRSERRDSRRWIAIPIAAVALGAWMVVRVASEPRPEAPPAPVPVVLPPPAATPPPPPPPPAAVETIEVRLQSTPSGAIVEAGRERLGTTPFVLSFPRSGEAITLRFRLEGHLPAERRVALDQSRVVNVALERKLDFRRER